MNEPNHPSPEAATAAALYELSTALSCLDGSPCTNLALQISLKADDLATLDISKRTDEYTNLQHRIDTKLRKLNKQIDTIKRQSELVHKAREIVKLVDDLINSGKGLLT